MLYGHFNPFIIIESLLLFLATVACLQYTKGITGGWVGGGWGGVGGKPKAG